MPLTEELVERARQDNDTAIIIIGRTAGEDKDNVAEAGSYYLTEIEEDMLKRYVVYLNGLLYFLM